MNDNEAIHINADLADDNNMDIEEIGFQPKQDDRHNRFCTIVENKLQPSRQIEGQKKANDWKTTDNREGEVVMTYDQNASKKTLHPRIFYAFYI